MGQVGNFWGATDRSQNVVTSLWFLLPIQYLRYHSVSDPLDYHWLLAGRVYTQNECSKPRGFPAGVGRIFNPRALIAASSMVGGSNYRETPLRRVGLLPMPPKRAPSGRHPLAHGERPLELETTRCQKHQPPLAI